MTIIIYLIGRSGSGKYTIAKELAKYGYRVVDNQLINNPIFALLDLDGVTPIPEAAWDKIAQIRTHVFDFISQEHKHNYVLTNELLEDEGDRRLFKQVQEMAESRGSLFVPVRLHLSKEENARRIQMPERALRFKSTKIDERVFKKSMINISHPNLLDLDINNLPVDVAANQILKTVSNLSKE